MPLPLSTAAAAADPPVLERAEIDGGTVRLVWSGGVESRFHHVWLRDHCPSGLHPSTRERLWDWGACGAGARATGARIDGGALRLDWSDGHASRFNGGYLWRHRYDDPARAARRTPPLLWRGADIRSRLPEADYRAVMADDGALLTYLETVRDTGFALVRNMPDRSWACEDIAHRVSFTRETNFGRRFDVVSRPDPNNQAYTHDALLAHTDLANREMPPGVQLLHCLEFDATGGDSLLVDGFACAEQLRAADPEAWRLLTALPIGHRFHDGHWDIRWRAPVIGLDADGLYHEIRHNPGLAAPLDVPFDQVDAAYDALRAFTARLRDPDNVLAFRLRPGDMMVFNNRRVLHGRAAFDPNSGPRRLQGCYVDLDEWHSRIRVLHGEHTQD